MAEKKMEKSKLYVFNFKGSWLGGKSVVKAVSPDAAWKALKKKWCDIEPLVKCKFCEIQDRDGVLYFDSGDY